MNIKKVLGKEVLVFDGAMGTMLIAHGMKMNECSAAYNVTHARLVEEIHTAYLKAGAQILKTNTFRANRYALEGTPYTPSEVITQAIHIAKSACEAVDRPVYIALDIGMIGKPLGGVDGITPEEMFELFKEQVEVGVKEGCDLILCETFMSLEELQIAIKAVRSCSDLPLFCTMSFDEQGQTYYGIGLEEMVAGLESYDVDAIGLNCSVAPMHLDNHIKRLMAISTKPVVVMPNAGVPEKLGEGSGYPVGPSAFATKMASFVEQGVRIVGGCCGTTPEYITQLVRSVTRN